MEVINLGCYALLMSMITISATETREVSVFACLLCHKKTVWVSWVMKISHVSQWENAGHISREMMELIFL